VTPFVAVNGVVTGVWMMAWVQYGRHRYYCRSVRRGRRVLKEYYKGVDAELAAALDQEKQRRRRAEREGLRLAKEAWAAADEPLRRLIDLTDLLAHIALLAAGYHRHHKGEWRKRRAQHR
jgi:hypothetical protein